MVDQIYFGFSAFEEHEKHNKLIDRVLNSPNHEVIWYVIDQYLAGYMTYSEALQHLSRDCKTLNNLELVEFLNTYQEYKKIPLDNTRN